MSYQVLALKYRPQTFEDVVGQEHVTTTLTNAISADRMAHAILLTGPRGTGKTTIARILAKAMTCNDGPTPTPCNTCKICTDIINGHCSDVFEIDGASNNSVEQIRDLRENVTYMPASARFKIYIIDEVHMLSVAAFNALLKTLEEPPAHVLFIFATTEVHKIPATILSRCQRHDLSRISLDKISDHLEKLCLTEGYTVEKEGLDLIALEADGSIRDSLSLTDRILSASPEKTITQDHVTESLGTTDRRLMFDISSAVVAKDGASLIRLVNSINDSGLDLKKFYSDIISHFRNLNIIKLCGKEAPSLNMIDAEKEELFRTVEELSPTYLGMLLQLLLDEENLVRFSSHTQTAVEMVLLKLIQINPGAQLDTIIKKLDLLARQIDAKLTQSNTEQSTQTAEQTISRTGHEPPKPKVTQSTPSATKNDTTNGPPPAQPITEPYPGPPTQNQVSHEPSPAPPQEPYPIDSGPVPDNYGIQEKQGPVTWPQFMEIIQTQLPFIFGLFSKGRVDTSAADHVTVTLETCSAFERTRLKSKTQALEQLSKTHLGKRIKVEIKAEASPMAASQHKHEEDKARNAAANHPMVQEARRLFDGEIV